MDRCPNGVGNISDDLSGPWKRQGRFFRFLFYESAVLGFHGNDKKTIAGNGKKTIFIDTETKIKRLLETQKNVLETKKKRFYNP